MTMDERVKAAVEAFGVAGWAALGLGDIRLSPRAEELASQYVREIIAAAFRELSGDKPTHWLAPTLLRERVDTVLETFGAAEAAGYQSRDRQYAIDMLRPARDAYLGKGDGG